MQAESLRINLDSNQQNYVILSYKGGRILTLVLGGVTIIQSQ